MGLKNDLKKPLTILFFVLVNNFEAISAARAPAESILETPSPYAQPPSRAPSPSGAPNPSEAPIPRLSDTLVSKDSVQESELRIVNPSGAASGSINMNSKVNKLCDATDYPSLCQSSILSFSDSAVQADTPTMLQLAIKAVVAETNSAVLTAQKLVDSPDVDDDLTSSLDDCKSMYESVLSGFQDAKDAIQRNDKGTLDSMLSGVISNIETCNDGFSESNPVATHNEKLTQMASNCLAIAALIKR